LELVGPARVTVTDPHGQMVGVDPAMQSPVIVTSIPGSRYSARSDTQLLILPNSGTLVATMRVSGAQPLQLTIRAFAGNRQTSQATFTLIEEVGTVMTLPLAAGQEPGSLRLRLDRPGHTAPARVIEPEAFVAGPAAAERTPPVSRARLEPATPGQYRVTLAAEDEPGGSGVAAIYYRVGEPELGNSLPPVYRQPLLVPAGATVWFNAIDRAGNRERAQQIVVPSVDAPQRAAWYGAASPSPGPAQP
jgi:hypothetical protein